MIAKIKTSMQTMKNFATLTASTGYQPYILAKLSIAISLRCEENLSQEDFATNSHGLELNRQTITGDFDDLFKALICLKENRYLLDEEYFPKYVKAHLDRGATLLFNEFRYKRNSLEGLLDIK